MKKSSASYSVKSFLLSVLCLSSFQLIIFSQGQAQSIFDPPALYSTWIDDPTSTLCIIWHSDDENGQNDQSRYTKFEYRLKNEYSEKWKEGVTISRNFPFSDRIMHRVDLKDLEPDREYSFRIGENTPDSLIFYFRTMPKQVDRAINFAAGGDTNAGEEFRKTNIQAVKHNLDFVMFGGDLEYSNGRPSMVEKVYDWLRIAKETLITADNRLIPILAAIGDHEFRRTRYNKEWGVNSREDIEKLEDKTESAPYYYAMFPFPGIPTWGVLDFGDYMSVVLLHAGAFPPIEGEQTEWLEQVLRERSDVPHVFPLYHHGIYPAVRTTYKEQEKYWAPLFEKYGVYVAFENHDHVYKRTYPIREGKIVEDGTGVVYLGDGSWGNLRANVRADRWYLARTYSLRSFIVGSLHPGDKKFQFRMYDNNGNRIDSYPSQE